MIDYIEIPSIEVQDIIDETGINFDVEIREATFSKSTGCGPDMSVEEFELSCNDDYAPKIYDLNDPVLVEREDAECSYGRAEIDELQMEKSKLRTELQERHKKVKSFEVQVALLNGKVAMQALAITELKTPWYKRMWRIF